MGILQTLQGYLSMGFHLIPILPGQKSPTGKGWNKTENAISTPEQLQNIDVDQWNWGINHLASGTCAIDIDNYEEAFRTLTDAGINLDHYLSNDVQIDSGTPGHAKLIYRVPFWIDPLPTVQIRDGKEMVLEFRCATMDGKHTVQDVLPPSRHPSGSFYRWHNGRPEDIDYLPDELLYFWQDHLQKRERTEKSGQTLPEIDDVLPDATSSNRITEALGFIDPDAERGVWLECGFAVHDALGEEGFEPWADWSRRGTKYRSEQDLESVWSSIHEQPNGITYRTLYMYAKRGGWKPVPTWAEIEQATKKEGAEGETAPERTLAERLLQEVEDMSPFSVAKPDTIIALQKILLEAEQISNPAHQIPIHEKIKEEAGWTQRILDTHLKYVRSKARDVLVQNLDGPRFIHMSPAGTPTDHTDNLQAICEHHGIEIRHNLMSHDLEISDPAVDWWLQDDATNLQYIHIRNLCVQYRMPHARADEHISAIGSRNSYHPMEEYLNATRWDGRDWFSQVADLVQTTNRELWFLTFWRWCLGVCAIVRGKTGDRPVRGVLVFTGEQYAGKTTFFRYLTPHQSMFGEGIQLNTGQKDSIKIATNKVIVELGELDRTFSRSDISSLKAFISTPYDELRLPYAHTESRWPRRTSFCGTVNDPAFLRDQTGNTRFWVNEALSIDLNTMEQVHKTVALQQFWAQVNYALDNGERWDMSKAEIRAIEQSNAVYLDYNLVDELLLDNFAWPEGAEGKPGRLSPAPVSPVNPMSILEIASFLGLDTHRGNNNAIRELRASLRRLTGETGSNRIMAYSWDPVEGKRATGAERGRWYSMPYPRPGRRIAKILPSGMAVVQGGKRPEAIAQISTGS